jgi:hypothetical protein
VKVGDGRGFVIEQRFSTAAFSGVARRAKLRLRPFVVKRVLVTAGHCLPKLPPAFAFPDTHTRTYEKLLSTLDGAMKDVWAECLFVDPIADIAVLGSPDGQVFYEEAEAYDAFIDAATVLPIGKARNGKGWLLALDRADWIPTPLRLISGIYGSSLEIGPTEPGMSGSPVLNDHGRAVGLVAIGSMTKGTDGVRVDTTCAGQPILTRNLPGWLLETIR